VQARVQGTYEEGMLNLQVCDAAPVTQRGHVTLSQHMPPSPPAHSVKLPYLRRMREVLANGGPCFAPVRRSPRV
jgi:hypothetical protein